MDSTTTLKYLSLMRGLISEYADTADQTVVCKVAGVNKDGTYDLYVMPDDKNRITSIVNSSPYLYKIGDMVYLFKVDNSIARSFIIGGTQAVLAMTDTSATETGSGSSSSGTTAGETTVSYALSAGTARTVKYTQEVVGDNLVTTVGTCFTTLPLQGEANTVSYSIVANGLETAHPDNAIPTANAVYSFASQGKSVMANEAVASSPYSLLGTNTTINGNQVSLAGKANANLTIESDGSTTVAATYFNGHFIGDLTGTADNANHVAFTINNDATNVAFNVSDVTQNLPLQEENAAGSLGIVTDKIEANHSDNSIPTSNAVFNFASNGKTILVTDVNAGSSYLMGSSTDTSGANASVYINSGIQMNASDKSVTASLFHGTADVASNIAYTFSVSNANLSLSVGNGSTITKTVNNVASANYAKDVAFTGGIVNNNFQLDVGDTPRHVDMPLQTETTANVFSIINSATKIEGHGSDDSFATTQAIIDYAGKANSIILSDINGVSANLAGVVGAPGATSLVYETNVSLDQVILSGPNDYKDTFLTSEANRTANLINPSASFTTTSSGLTLTYDKDTDLFTMNGTSTGHNNVLKFLYIFKGTICDKPDFALTLVPVGGSLSVSNSVKVLFLFNFSFNTQLGVSDVSLSNVSNQFSNSSYTNGYMLAIADNTTIDGVVYDNYQFRLMLNEGNVALPYTANAGSVIHETDLASSLAPIQTSLDNKVSKTGDETIAGVKTFSSSPIIPTTSQATTGNLVASVGGQLDETSISLSGTTLTATLNGTANKVAHTFDFQVNGTSVGTNMPYDGSNASVVNLPSQSEVTANVFSIVNSGTKIEGHGSDDSIPTTQAVIDYAGNASAIVLSDINGYSANLAGVIGAPGSSSPVYETNVPLSSVALLDGNGKILITEIPDYILGQASFGGFIAADGVCSLSDNFKNKYGISSLTITTNESNTYEGVYFIASGNGTLTGTGSYATISYLIGDWVMSIGTSGYGIIDNTDAVRTVTVEDLSGNAVGAATGDVVVSPSTMGITGALATKLPIANFTGANIVSNIGVLYVQNASHASQATIADSANAITNALNVVSGSTVLASYNGSAPVSLPTQEEAEADGAYTLQKTIPNTPTGSDTEIPTVNAVIQYAGKADHLVIQRPTTNTVNLLGAISTGSQPVYQTNVSLTSAGLLTAANVNAGTVSLKTHTHGFTPAGIVTVSAITPAGSVSAPSITVTPDTTTVSAVSGRGTLSSFTPHSGSFTPASLGFTYNNSSSERNLEISFSGGSHADPTYTFSAGTLMSYTNVSVVSGIKSASASAPAFTGSSVIPTASFAGTSGSTGQPN